MACAWLKLPGLPKGGRCADAVLNCRCPQPVTSLCAIKHLSKYSPCVRVVLYLFLGVNTTSDWSLNCSPCSYVFPYPRPVGRDCWKESPRQHNTTRMWSLPLFMQHTQNKCLEKCLSKSFRIKYHGHKQRWSSVRRSVTWSKNYVMCKNGEKSKLLIQDVEALVLLPQGAPVQSSEGCWDLHAPDRAYCCRAVARRPHASSVVIGEVACGD